ncbi:MAG: cobalt ECF transporter T component CbiQ [Chloroflexi bacterium]|nr:cobalt ECF transporter T component CbiQ [Chloroflexota bacterium]
MMHTHLLDRYREAQSVIHRLDPRVKVVVTLLFIVSTALLPDGAWFAFALSFILVLSCSFLARLGVTFALRRSFVVLPFALAAITAIIAVPGRPLFMWQIGGTTIIGTDAGVVRFLSILARSWLSVQMAIVLTATTNVPDLLHALRHLRVPEVLVAIVGFMLRYLSVLADEAARLLRAREARSALLANRRGGGSPGWRARVAGYMAGQLFLRSYERSDRVYNAMLARGFAGRFLAINPHLMREHDWWALAVTVVALTVVQLAGQGFPPG